MRAGPLSDVRVISLLNRYFVPVYVSNEDYAPGGSVPPEERAEKDRIYHETLKAGLSAGTVHAYVLSPDGRVLDSLHVAVASRTDRLIAMLERTIAKLKTPEGRPLVKPVAQSAPPSRPPDALVLHLTARSLRPGGAWGEFPAENWIVLRREQWTNLLPARDYGVGNSWDVDPAVARALLTHFYPATENNDLSTNRIERQKLTARVVSLRDGVARVRLDGSLRMKHTFYHRDDNNVVDATVLGLFDVDTASRQIRSLRLATSESSYGGGTFGVAVQSVP